MRKIFIVFIFIILPNISFATTVLYRISSGEVINISAVNDMFDPIDKTYFSVLVDPALPDGSQIMTPQGEYRVLGYAKIYAGGIVRNATQVEIDGFEIFAVSDQKIIRKNMAIKRLQNDPSLRRITKAIIKELVDQLNLLRQEHGMSTITYAQAYNAILNRISEND